MLRHVFVPLSLLFVFILVPSSISASPIAVSPALSRIYVTPDKSIPVKVTFKNNKEPGYLNIKIKNDPEVSVTRVQPDKNPLYLRPDDIVDVYIDAKTPKGLEDKDYLIEIYLNKTDSLLQDSGEVGVVLATSLRSDVVLSSLQEKSVNLTPRTILLEVANGEVIGIIENKSKHLIEYVGNLTVIDPKGRKKVIPVKGSYLRPFSQKRLSYNNIFNIKGKYTITQNIINTFGKSFDSIYHHIW